MLRAVVFRGITVVSLTCAEDFHGNKMIYADMNNNNWILRKYD